MKIFNDKKVIALVIILVVFTIGYFIAANKISYAFSTDYSKSDSYNNTIETIKKCAIAYAKETPSLFKDENIAYIKVQDLIDNKYIVTNADGNIPNPLKENELLNSNIIKLKKESNEISAEFNS